MKKKITLINGANLNLLGSREPEIYGNATLASINENLEKQFSATVIFQFHQSNEESFIVNLIQQTQLEADALIINAGGFSHTSVVIADAIAALKIPTIAVHISNIFNRENYRQQDIVGEKCKGSIIGVGAEGYALAVDCLQHDYFKL